jgi:hypothetical protein
VTVLSSAQFASYLQYAIPKFDVLSNVFEKVVYPDQTSPFYSLTQGGAPGDDVIISVNDQQGTAVPHLLYVGFAIACSSVIVRPVFLRPASTPWNQAIASFESDLDYMCLMWVDPADLVSKWFCAAGNLAEGVVGVVRNNSSPRTFIVNTFTWGPNTWDHHWEYPSGLGSISKRIDAAYQTGYAQDDAWNLNPNDYHANGTSKALDYIAAVNVKTTTNRNGVHISPYNTTNVRDYIAANPNYASIDPRALALLNPSEMNQGEAETRSCGVDTSNCFDYFHDLDVLSNGQIANGSAKKGYFGVVDLVVSPSYQSMAQSGACSWQADWNLPVMQTATYSNVVNWSVAPYDGSALDQLTLPTSAYKVAVSRGSLETQRCPSWQLCEGSSSPPHNAFLLSQDANLNLLPSTTTAFSYNSRLPCGKATSQACMGLLCGQPAVARRADKALADWWSCAAPACDTAGGHWQLACASSSSCTVSVADSDVYLVNTPPSVRSKILLDGPDIDVGQAVAKAGL